MLVAVVEDVFGAQAILQVLIEAEARLDVVMMVRRQRLRPAGDGRHPVRQHRRTVAIFHIDYAENFRDLTLVEADIDGNGTADFQIDLVGGDFLL